MGKAETIQGLIEARQKIIDTVAAIPDKKREEIFLGTWAVTDLLAHLIGWDYANIDSVNDIRAGKSPRVFQSWNPDWRAFNARLVKQYKRADWNEMLKAIHSSHRDLIKFLKTVPADELEKDFGVRSPRGRNITLAHHLQAEIEDEQEHYQQIRDWLK